MKESRRKEVTDFAHKNNKKEQLNNFEYMELEKTLLHFSFSLQACLKQTNLEPKHPNKKFEIKFNCRDFLVQWNPVFYRRLGNNTQANYMYKALCT